ncbi:uncharacterized protein KD926_006709 [Aspergillus affinis]|uniref:uncharacterized protein n=1 Tax=Aspergillus affinis TaxID=1070780 RepID=UPI0022FEEB23|nr:uncharacterized protein KD926_006709 [Aspergillus affinis]KAI9041635.1 hypothetical protein KD926_006709 [Aspergillus affinis]
MTEQALPELPLPFGTPVRILVHTTTGLVPKDLGLADNVWGDKNTSMLDRISRHHWNLAYQSLNLTEIRFYNHNCDYGYDDRRCFFGVDHGTTSNDEEVPILCWEWTGEKLDVCVQRKELSIRSRVKDGLRKAKKIPEDELMFMLEHPHDMQWLADNMMPRFWPKFLAQAKRLPRKKREATVLWKIGKWNSLGTPNSHLIQSPEIQAELKAVPFTPRPRATDPWEEVLRKQQQPTPTRQIVRRRLRKAQKIPTRSSSTCRATRGYGVVGVEGEAAVLGVVFGAD